MYVWTVEKGEDLVTEGGPGGAESPAFLRGPKSQETEFFMLL